MTKAYGLGLSQGIWVLLVLLKKCLFLALVILYLAKEARRFNFLRWANFWLLWKCSPFCEMSPFSVCWFLLNKRWPTPFLRLKSFCEARFESYIDSVPKSLQNQEKCFVHCFPNQTRRLVPLRAKMSGGGSLFPMKSPNEGSTFLGAQFSKFTGNAIYCSAR